MAVEELPIIIVIQSDPRSRREQELEQARIRSHAARISSKRRKSSIRAPPTLPLQTQQRHQCYQGDPSQCALCSMPKLQHDWQTRCLARRDPFAAHAGHDLPAVIHKAIDYAFDNSWLPVYARLWPEAEYLQLKGSLIRELVRHPPMFHSSAVGATAIALSKISDHDSTTARVLRQHQVEQHQLALRHLSNDIQSPTFFPDEVHVHAVCTLARHTKPVEGSDEADPLSLEPYPLSPMAWLQSLYPLSCLDLVHAHVEAMYYMVKMRGGISTVAQPLLDILQVTDISISTLTGSLPRFPLVSMMEPSELFPEMDLGTWKIGGADHGRNLTIVRYINKPMHRILTKMVQLTKVADCSNHGPWSQRQQSILIFGRYDTQHGLMAYPTSQSDISKFAVSKRNLADEQDADLQIDSAALTEAIRLSASIYSDMVLFQHPWMLGIKRRLAKRLYQVWQSGELYELFLSQPSYHELYIWVLWFGCFGSLGSRWQQWFELELLRVLEACYGARLRRLTFEDVRESLKGFLWWDTVCEEPGRALWSRVACWRTDSPGDELCDFSVLVG